MLSEVLARDEVVDLVPVLEVPALEDGELFVFVFTSVNSENWFEATVTVLVATS